MELNIRHFLLTICTNGWLWFDRVSGSFTIVKISFCNRKELYTVLSYMSLRSLHKGAVGGRKEWHICITRHWVSFNQHSILMHIMALFKWPLSEQSLPAAWGHLWQVKKLGNFVSRFCELYNTSITPFLKRFVFKFYLHCTNCLFKCFISLSTAFSQIPTQEHTNAVISEAGCLPVKPVIRSP